VLHPVEPFFHDIGYDSAVHDEGGIGVVATMNSENIRFQAAFSW
jgi:hypothetical protein